MNQTMPVAGGAAIAVLAAVALAGPSAARDDGIPAATPVGAPQACISRSRISQSLVRSDSVIDFVMLDRKVYRVTLPQACPELGYEERFGYALSIDRLCSTDIITVLRNSPLGRGASCSLAPFQQVMLAPRPKQRR